jgi:hypothetical protein
MWHSGGSLPKGENRHGRSVLSRCQFTDGYPPLLRIQTFGPPPHPGYARTERNTEYMASRMRSTGASRPAAWPTECGVHKASGGGDCAPPLKPKTQLKNLR